MPQKPKKTSPQLFEYKISFITDQRKSVSERHYLAYNARDALGMFAYAILKSLFDRKIYNKAEFFIVKEYVKIHDKTIDTPKFQIEEATPPMQKPKQPKLKQSTGKDLQDSVVNIVKDMCKRIELLKIEEFNPWANRWYSLKLPLEEFTDIDNP